MNQIQIATLVYAVGIAMTLAIILRSQLTMSDTTQNMTAQLTALRDTQVAQVAASTKFRADVSLFIARMADTKPNAEQQALIDEMRASMASDTQADTDADAGVVVPETPAA